MSVGRVFLLAAMTAMAVLPSFAATGLTYTAQNAPFACPNTAVYFVWYGSGFDATSQAAIIDWATYGMPAMPSTAIANLYPLRAPAVYPNVSFTYGGQVSTPYSAAYNGGVANQLKNGATGAGALVGALVTGGQIPAAGSCASAGVNVYVLIFLGTGLTSSTGNPCGYSENYTGQGYPIAVISDVSTNGCPYTFGNKVSGTTQSDQSIFVANFEMTHGLMGLVWKQGASTIEEVCTNQFGTTQAAPTDVCSPGANCQYSVSLSTAGGTKYYLLQQTYLQLPPGTTNSGACVFNYTVPSPGISLIGEQ